MKAFRIIQLVLFMGLPVLSEAQDPEFTQTMGTPSYFNPAFCGIQQNLRVGLQYRDQWPNAPGSIISIAASADMGIPSINSGVGLMYMNDQAADADLTTNTINAYYAYEVKLGPRSYLRFGINPSIFQRSVNSGQLVYGNQINPQTGVIQGSNGGTVSTAFIPNMSAGALFYNNNFYAGLAAYNIFEPNESLVNGYATLPRKFVVQAGYYLSLGQIMFNPYVLAMDQGTFRQVLPGVNATLGLFTLGASFRQTDPNADAVNFLIGFAKGIFKVCYSYDLTVSDARAAATGSHELSLVVQLNKPCDTSDKPMIGHLRNSY